MHKTTPLYLYLAAFLVVLTIPNFSFGEQTNCFTAKWPSELSHIPPDPSLLRGKLKNGFRYVIKQNSEPEDRVAIYLAVQAGSLHEKDEQRGVAHFLEHMMFNGSANFPPGSLVEYFQSIGMNFGGDINAHTTYDQTVYHIILPSGSDQDLDSGFLVMADYARGALLLDSEIDRERDVILAEKRARDSAGYRSHVASTAFKFRGTRYPERMVIGVQNSLEEADRRTLKSYYDSWYSPENMIFVVVGDIEPKVVEAFVEKHFSKLISSGLEPVCPDFGKLAHHGLKAFYHHEPELGKTDVAIETFWDLPKENDSIELEKRELLKFVGSLIMGYRLQRMQETDKQPFGHALYYSGNVINRIGYGSIAAQTDADNWQKSLSVLDRTLRQAVQFGFVEDEVVRAKKEILAHFDTKVLTADSKNSRTIARRIIEHLNNNRVYQSARQEKALYGPIVSDISVDEVNKAFQAVWDHNYRVVSVKGDARLGDDGDAVVLDLYRAGLRQPVSEPFRQIDKTFPYLQPSLTPYPPPQTNYFDDIDVEKLVFKNGMQLNLKKTDFSKNRFQLIVNFGDGEQAASTPGMAMLAESVINSSGSGRLEKTDIDALIAGSSVDLSFTIGESSFSWRGTALFKDFELFSQLLHTLLLDPGARENAFNTVMANFELMYQKIERQIEGAVPLEIQPFLAGYDSHFGMPAWEDIARIDFGQLRKWVETMIRPKDMEISVVGDFDRDEAIAILGKYFGALELSQVEQGNSSIINFPAGEQREVKVATSVDKSLISVAWPSEDCWDIQRTRRLHLLATVFEDRLRKIIREKLGASYSPSVSSFCSKAYKNYGFINAQMIVKPGTEDEIIEQIFKVSDSLVKEGVGGDELLRAKSPLITSLNDSIKTNHYWLYSVLSLSGRYPQQLSWPKTIISDFTSISEADVNELAHRYLDNRNAAIVKVTPDREKTKVSQDN